MSFLKCAVASGLALVASSAFSIDIASVAAKCDGFDVKTLKQYSIEKERPEYSKAHQNDLDAILEHPTVLECGPNLVKVGGQGMGGIFTIQKVGVDQLVFEFQGQQAVYKKPSKS